MPQKRNPERSEHLCDARPRRPRRAPASRSRGWSASTSATAPPGRPSGRSSPTPARAAAAALTLRRASSSTGLRVDAARMRANLDAQRGYVLAEPAMLALARAGSASTARTSSSTAPRWPARRRALTLRGGARGATRRSPRGARPRRAAAARSARSGPVGARSIDARAGTAMSRAACPAISARRRGCAAGRRRSSSRPGYELELADAPLLHRGLGARRPRARRSRIRRDPGRRRGARCCGALLELLDDGRPSDDSRYGDLVNVRERALEQRIGTAAGWLNAGRPRREAGRIAFRIALRDRAARPRRRRSLRFARRARRARRARARHADARLHLPAGRAADDRRATGCCRSRYPALRDARARSRATSPAVNRSPAGAGGVNGSRFPLDRERLARAARLRARRSSTRATRCGRPTGSTEAAWHAATAATNASRFAEDLELYGSDEFGLLAIGDELCRASALMPQKRNPYALVVIRGARGHAARPGDRRAGHAAHAVRAAPTTCSTPTARSRGAVELATRDARPRRGGRRERARSIATGRARRARELRAGHRRRRGAQPAARARLPHGLQHRRPRGGRGRAHARGLDAAAALGRWTSTRALDARPTALATRTVTGGAAPAPMDAMLDAARRATRVDASARERLRRRARGRRSTRGAEARAARSAALGSRSSVS